MSDDFQQRGGSPWGTPPGGGNGNGSGRGPTPPDVDKIISTVTTKIGAAGTTTHNLQNGDIVHRHMMDGDAVLFNRQPSLHRMSMMCHIAKIMKQGDTFRMNVADTKPYNADFDGDEMNLHMPQDEEAECELRNLAAVPYQIISPANNKSIVGIFQDSLLGIYRLNFYYASFTSRKR